MSVVSLREYVALGLERVYTGKLVHAERSSYQRIEVVEHEHFGRMLVLEGAVQTTERDEHCYHEMLVHPALSALPEVERVLVIGGGDGGALRRALEHGPKEAVLCELDPRVVDVCRQHMPAIAAGAFDHPCARIEFADGAAFVAAPDCAGRFDAIVVDPPDPRGPALSLFSDAFYGACKRALRPGGTLAMQAGTPLFLPRHVASVKGGLERAFAHVEVYGGLVPAYPGVYWAFVCATDSAPISQITSDVIAARLQARGVITRAYHAQLHRAAFVLPKEIASRVDADPAEADSVRPREAVRPRPCRAERARWVRYAPDVIDDAPPADAFITNLDELRRHAGDRKTREGYARLLADLGIDPTIAGDGPPRVIFAEQPGCWFWPRDLDRIRAAVRIAREGGLDEAASGAFTVANDAFTATGSKGTFLDLELHPRLGSARVAGHGFMRRWRGRAFSEVVIDGAAARRGCDVFDTATLIVRAASTSGAELARTAAELGLAAPGGDKRGAAWRRAFDALAADLSGCDLDRAARDFEAAREPLAAGAPWVDAWGRVNERLSGVPIRLLDDLLDRWLLSIEDPVRLAVRLGEIGGWAPDAIAIAAVVDDRGAYLPVSFDPATRGFVLRRPGGERAPIAWSTVREHAARGRSGGPAGTLEYLLFAACRIYLVVDSGDAFFPYMERAARVHVRALGSKLPCVAFHPPYSEGCDYALALYEPDAGARFERAIECFLRGPSR